MFLGLVATQSCMKRATQEKSPTNMKRNAQPTRCTQCQQQFGQGFALINHKRYCFVVSAAQSKDKDEHSQSPRQQHEDEHHQSSTQDEDEHHQSSTQDDEVHFQSWTQDQGEDQGQDPGKEQGLQHTQQQGIMRMRRKLLRMLNPKLKAIVEFLEKVEFGEGESRAHSQHSLDYTRSCVCAKTMLLPKDIRTCWNHVIMVFCDVSVVVSFVVSF